MPREAADNSLRVLPEVGTPRHQAESHVLHRAEHWEADVSLLNQGTESVTVFQEVQTPDTDSDGNKITRAALIGALVRAVVQPISSTENTDGGFNTESRDRLRLINYLNILSAQSQIEWNGKRYSILGDAMICTTAATERSRRLRNQPTMNNPGRMSVGITLSLIRQV